MKFRAQLRLLMIIIIVIIVALSTISLIINQFSLAEGFGVLLRGLFFIGIFLFIYFKARD